MVHVVKKNSNKSDIDGITEGIDKMVLSDDKLFAEPPPKEDCPICFLPMPFAGGGVCGVRTAYQPCCGKRLCQRCMHAVDKEIKKGNIKDSCAMCRLQIPNSNRELLNRFKRRMKANDVEAFHQLSDTSTRRALGLPHDKKKEFEMALRAAELGSIKAHYSLAQNYLGGIGVEEDEDKAIFHFKQAAIRGHEISRQYLGLFDERDGDIDRAMKHYMIAAKSGDDDSLKKVGEGYKTGHVKKDQYEKTLRAYQYTCIEMRNEQRSKAPTSLTR